MERGKVALLWSHLAISVSQVTKVKTNGNTAGGQRVPLTWCDEDGTLPLWSSLHTHHPSRIRKTSDKPKLRGILQNICTVIFKVVNITKTTTGTVQRRWRDMMGKRNTISWKREKILGVNRRKPEYHPLGNNNEWIFFFQLWHIPI